MNKVKVEVGQEWIRKNFIMLVEIVQPIGFGYARMAGIYNFMDLDSFCYPMWDHWEYLGTPIKCENCNKFCKQSCGKS